MTTTAGERTRPLIAFFGHADVFEDFYPHYGVTQQHFASRFADTGNHAFLTVLQRDIGNVLWYEMSTDPQLEEAHHEVVGCRIRFLKASPAYRGLWKAFYMTPGAWRWRGLYPKYAPLAAYLSLLSPALWRCFARERPDAIFAQDYSSGRFEILLLMARLFRIPLIAYHSGSLPAHYAYPALKRRTIRRAGRIIASSTAERDMLVRDYRVDPAKADVVLTPIDLDRFRPLPRAEACAAEGLPAGRRYLLFVGRLENRVKKIDVIVQQFLGLAGRFPDVDLLIAGTGPDADKLAALAGGSPRVRFLGWVSDKARLANLYNVAEALLLPSMSEGFPTVVGESMACGTPLIASAVGGVPELVEHGVTGWLLPPGDGPRLGACMAEALGEPERLAAIRRQARARAEARLAPAVVGAQLRAAFRAAGVAHV